MSNNLDTKIIQHNPAYLLLLSKFIRGNSPNNFLQSENWSIALKEKPSNIIDAFIIQGLLVPADINELIDFKFRVSDLKDICRTIQVKTTGSKPELIERLIKDNSELMKKETIGLDIYKCSIEGKTLAEEYLNKEKEKREKTELDVINLLKLHQFKKAMKNVCNFEATQIFPRGLGIDWKNYNYINDIESLEVIFNKTPSILNNISIPILDRIRIIAGMMFVWGTNNSKKWFIEEINTGIHLNKDAAARMLIFYSSYLGDLRRYKSANIKFVEISATNDKKTCLSCKNLDGKKFKTNNLLELPNPNCECEDGCRCTTIAEI